MKLQTVHFDAYKSLLGTRLHLTHPCMGMVGINESGKSNVLRAIKSLSREHRLGPTDVPKMSKHIDPYVRFVFSVDDEDIAVLKSCIDDVASSLSLLDSILTSNDLTITYHVRYKKTAGQEERFFTIDNVQLPEGVYTRRSDALTEGYQVKFDNTFVALNKVLLLSTADLNINSTLGTVSDELTTLHGRSDELEAEITQLESSNQSVPVTDPPSGESTTTPPDKVTPDSTHNIEARSANLPGSTLAKKREELSRVLERMGAARAYVSGFDIHAMMNKVEEGFEALQQENKRHNTIVATSTKQLAALEAISAPDEEQKKQIPLLKRAITTSTASIDKNHKAMAANRRRLASLQQPLSAKFTDDPLELAKRLGQVSHEEFQKRLPQVVFWTYSDNYILKGETEFAQLKKAKSLDEMSRPLVNLFRIGLDIDSFDSLNKALHEIQTDSSERSRHQDTLNAEIHAYLKSVWPDYDHTIRMTLEKERIRVQFVDPTHVRASYYEMQERSQGCQTFISFLLTIGAEAKHGVIKNTVLLLDEPETHLHPSGVRYMLHELIKAADSGNTVLFATHSIFMIDTHDYDRHLIIKKEKETTVIKPSTKDRIGYFMQEEVLYGAVDSDLVKALPARNKLNFVLEGEGDVVLFNAFYNRGLREGDRPVALKMTSFYQGGKCSDIKKYFSQKPIYLGSKWVFILDNDLPANDLKEFIEGRYRDYLNKDIFVFQYFKTSDPTQLVEFEDLLPLQMIEQAVSSAAKECGASAAPSPINENQLFATYCTAIAKVVGKDEFKGIVKEHLNQSIAAKIKAFTKQSEFETALKEYVAWALTITSELAEKMKSPTKAA
jgi:hypothetical protein